MLSILPVLTACHIQNCGVLHYHNTRNCQHIDPVSEKYDLSVQVGASNYHDFQTFPRRGSFPSTYGELPKGLRTTTSANLPGRALPARCEVILTSLQ